MIKSIARKISGLRIAYQFLLNTYSKYKICRLKKLQKTPFLGNPDSNLIVSLTSFPARIGSVWITIETIFQQDYKPWKVVLVLSEEEFPNKQLPLELNKQVERGLEILWTKKNIRSFKKLLPTREKYPDAVIVTIDDDVFYESWRLSQLVDASKMYPNTIIGHRGSEPIIQDNGLAPYCFWKTANGQTFPKLTFLTGVGGILYPPYILDAKLLLDTDKALEICPTADDIWFFAVALKSDVPILCLGNHRVHSVYTQIGTPALFDMNVREGKNDEQLKRTFDTLNLWAKVLHHH